MKSNPTVLNTITGDRLNEVGCVLRAEWNMNRYYHTLVDNTPVEDEEGYDVELFPIESIAEPNRPTSGICKAIVGQSTVAGRYHDTPPTARYYVVDPDDNYKYWQSPQTSDSGTFEMLKCKPHVIYADDNDNEMDIIVNKIRYTVERTFAYPTSYEVQTKTAAGSWTIVAQDIAIPADGRVELWYDGAAWTTTPNYNNFVSLSGVRIVVRYMDKEAFFNLIELGFAQERDISADVVSWSDNFTMGEPDFITPLGTISANVATVNLFSDSGTYDVNNASGPLYGLLDKGVKMTCFTKFGSELVQEFEMYSESWPVTDREAAVSLVDASHILMETKAPTVLYRDMPVQEIIWRICDSVGFNAYDVSNVDTRFSVDTFWTDPQKTVWETLSDLSRATQTAIYFDHRGRLQIKMRSAAWDASLPVAYDFVATSTATTPANIVDGSITTKYEANKVTVNWTPTSFPERRDHIVPFQVVWEPEGDLVLRSTPLSKNLNIGDSIMLLKSDEGKTWPWSGIANIEGEWIAFDAKRYVYYDSNDVRQRAWVGSYEQQQELDESGKADYRHYNHYTGEIRISERGLFNTEEKDHKLSLDNWTKTRRRNYSSEATPCSGIMVNRGESSVTIQGTGGADMKDYTYLHHGNAVDDGYRYIGCRLRIDKSSHTHKTGGIFFNGDGGLGTGYYVEIMSTSRMNSSMRNTRNEVIFYSMKSDGSKKFIGGKEVRLKDKSKDNTRGAVTVNDTGARYAVAQGRYIDLDIWLDTTGDNDRVQIYANGDYLMEAVIQPGNGWKHAKVSKFGIYARGNSSLTFDYVYGVNSPGVEKTDSEGYWDRIDGGYYSSQRPDWTFHTRDVRRKVRKRWKKYSERYKQRFYEEFGPMVHEIREFDVQFTSENPVLQSKIYFSNESQVVCTEFTGGVEGAKFMIGNISRETAVVSGDDERTSGGNGAINHKLFVYGRPVIQTDTQKVERVDAQALRRRGPIELEFSSPWVQNKQAAEGLADWLVSHWTDSDTLAELEVFGNPLVELTDLVGVDYDYINGNFYVIGVSNSYDGSLTTSLSLRSVGTAQ